MGAGTIVELDGAAYRLAAPLAASSYGVVWRGLRRGDGLPVALKLVNRAEMARAPAALRARWADSILRETAFLRALAPWDARHIVRLLDSGGHEGLPALALELLGPDLGRHCAALRDGGNGGNGGNGGSMPALAQTLRWLAQVNQALAKVHQHGWSYLDLKPANLLLDVRDGGLRLTDFGASRPLGAAPAREYAGTAAWQAPEQFFPTPCGYAGDSRSDYFALGALFYYLLTGSALNYCRSVGAAWRRHGLAAQSLLPRTLPTLLDSEAHAVERLAGAAGLALLRTLVARAPAERPASALEISRLIARIPVCRQAARVEACA